VDVGEAKNQGENFGERSVVSYISNWESGISGASSINDWCKVVGKCPSLGGSRQLVSPPVGVGRLSHF